MSNKTDHANAFCPFYVDSGQNWVKCDPFWPFSYNVTIRFKPGGKQEFFENFCCAPGFALCPYARLLNGGAKAPTI